MPVNGRGMEFLQNSIHCHHETCPLGNLPVPDTAGFPDGKQNLKPAILDDLELKLEVASTCDSSLGRGYFCHVGDTEWQFFNV